MINNKINSSYNKIQKGGGGPLIILKILKLIFFKKPLIGLLHPLSMTFSTLTVPIIMIILTIHNKQIKDFMNKYLNIDIQKSKSYFNLESLKELKIVYLCYFILSQIIVTTIFTPLGGREIKKGKLLSISLLELPQVLFDIISLIIIPRMAYNFIGNHLTFQFDTNRKMSAQIMYYSVIFAMIGLNNVWNYVNTIVAFIVTLFIVILLDKNLNVYYPAFDYKSIRISLGKIKIKKIFYNLFGFQFPDKKYLSDYMKVCSLLGFFIFTLISTFSKYIPYYYYLLGYELDIIQIIIKILMSVVLPIMFRDMGKNTRYETEIFLLGNLITIFIPLLFQPMIDIIYEFYENMMDKIFYMRNQ